MPKGGDQKSPPFLSHTLVTYLPDNYDRSGDPLNAFDGDGELKPDFMWLADVQNKSSPVIGDTSHKYVGTDSRGDVYQIFDGTNVLEWAVKVGDDSRNVLPGSLVNLGPPSSMTTAQAPAATVTTPTVTTPTAPASNTVNNSPAVVPAPSIAANTDLAHVAGDPSHKYVGTDSRGDVYQLFDGTNVIEWAVKPGDDSRNAIGGTIVNLGPPSSMTTAQATPPATVVNNSPQTSVAVPGAASTVPGTGTKSQVATVDTPGNYSLGTTSAASIGTPGVPGTTLVNNPATATVGETPPRASSPRHKYVGRDARGDVWQLFDGTNVIEWAVVPGDPSGNVIQGSLRNLGAPSNMTVAQNDGTLPGSPGSTVPGTGANLTTNASVTGSATATPAAGQTSFAGLAIAGLGVLVQLIK